MAVEDTPIIKRQDLHEIVQSIMPDDNLNNNNNIGELVWE